MDVDFESRVWRHASELLAGQLGNVLRDGLVSFKRRPGLDDLTRVYQMQIGLKGFDALRGAMASHGYPQRDWDNEGFIVLRSSLRTHLRRCLQWQLMQASDVADELSEDYLAGDLGL